MDKKKNKAESPKQKEIPPFGNELETMLNAISFASRQSTKNTSETKIPSNENRKFV